MVARHEHLVQSNPSIISITMEILMVSFTQVSLYFPFQLRKLTLRGKCSIFFFMYCMMNSIKINKFIVTNKMHMRKHSHSERDNSLVCTNNRHNFNCDYLTTFILSLLLLLKMYNDPMGGC